MKKTLLLSCKLTVAAFVFAALVGVACENIDADVDFENAQAQGIVKGTPTNYEQFQGVIGMLTGMSMCTGTLIAPDVILSAGHCVHLIDPGYGMDEVNYISKPEQLIVIGGAAPINGEEIYYSNAERIIAHPKWPGGLSNTAVDLSMIKLSEPIEGVQVYGVRTGVAPTRGDKGKIVGYGLLSSANQRSAGVHRMGDTTVKRVDNRVIELGNPTGTCQGDSGGPFLTQENGEWVISGVTSFGTSYMCLPTGGGYDVNVATYRTWIEDTFRELTGRDLSDVDTSPPGTDDSSSEDVVEDEDGVDEGSSSGEGTGEPDGMAGNNDGEADGDLAVDSVGTGSGGSCSISPVPFSQTLLRLFLAIL